MMSIKRGQGELDLESDKKRALALTPVSRETEARLLMFVELLLHWQKKINLVAESTLPQIWTRHSSLFWRRERRCGSTWVPV